MGIITLVGYIVARVGYTFLFTGGGPECVNCRLRKVCIDKLRKGHVYRVTKVLGIRNKCPINGWVITVEVEEVPVRAAIPKRYAVEGMIFKYVKPETSSKGICSPDLLPKEAKVKVVKVYGKAQCGGIQEPLMEADVIVVE
ncbi:MAG: UPF0179 family protein [Desulfurococcales archaeon]|nr:UPF0179 family protein [Desulfurococcales archaeon]